MNDRPPELEIKQEVRSLDDGRDVAIVTAVGDIDLATADEFAAALNSARADSANGLVIDVRGVRFIDSSGLRTILVAAKELGGNMATVVAPDSPVSMLVDLAEVVDRVNPVSDEDEALARIEQTGERDAG